MAPQPVFGLALQQLFEGADVLLYDVVLLCLQRMGAELAQYHLVASAAHLVDHIIDHGVVVFAGEIFGTIEKRCFLVQERGPVTLAGVAWRLVGQHHIGRGDVVAVVEPHHLAHIGLVDHLGAIAYATTGDECAYAFVVEWFAYSHAVMGDLKVERGHHIFPVVVVLREQDDALPLLVVFVEDLAVHDAVASANLRACGYHVEYSLYEQVA